MKKKTGKGIVSYRLEKKLHVRTRILNLNNARLTRKREGVQAINEIPQTQSKTRSSPCLVVVPNEKLQINTTQYSNGELYKIDTDTDTDTTRTRRHV